MELDAKTLTQIRDIGGSDLLGRLARLYLENTPVRLEEFRRGLARSDWRRAALAIHSVRSSSLTLGVMSLAENAAELEKLAEGGQKAELEQALPAFEALTREALLAVSKFA